MKTSKLFLVSILVLTITGCGLPVEKVDNETQVEISRIRGHQYIKNRSYGSYFIYTHLGDCDAVHKCECSGVDKPIKK